MLNLFKKDPLKKLQKHHARLMEEAMHLQRSGDLKAYARKVEEAEQVAQNISAIKASKA